MLVWEVIFGEKCPNKCEYKQDIYWNYVICKNI